MMILTHWQYIVTRLILPSCCHCRSWIHAISALYMYIVIVLSFDIIRKWIHTPEQLFTCVCVFFSFSQWTYGTSTKYIVICKKWKSFTFDSIENQDITAVSNWNYLTLTVTVTVTLTLGWWCIQSREVVHSDLADGAFRLDWWCIRSDTFRQWCI